jgi:hypothetical protein
MGTFPVSGTEITICSHTLTRTIGVLLALDIRTLAKFKSRLHGVLYCWITGKEGMDTKVKIFTRVLSHAYDKARIS